MSGKRLKCIKYKVQDFNTGLAVLNKKLKNATDPII